MIYAVIRLERGALPGLRRCIWVSTYAWEKRSGMFVGISKASMLLRSQASVGHIVAWKPSSACAAGLLVRSLFGFLRGGSILDRAGLLHYLAAVYRWRLTSFTIFWNLACAAQWDTLSSRFFLCCNLLRRLIVFPWEGLEIMCSASVWLIAWWWSWVRRPLMHLRYPFWSGQQKSLLELDWGFCGGFSRGIGWGDFLKLLPQTRVNWLWTNCNWSKWVQFRVPGQGLSDLLLSLHDVRNESGSVTSLSCRKLPIFRRRVNTTVGWFFFPPCLLFEKWAGIGGFREDNQTFF